MSSNHDLRGKMQTLSGTQKEAEKKKSGSMFFSWLGNLSLRLRLCLFFTLLLVAAWTLAALLAWLESREYIDEFYDTQQLLFAKRLAAADFGSLTDRLPSSKSAFQDDASAEPGMFEDDALAFAVFSYDGAVLLTDGQKGDSFIFQNESFGFIESTLYGYPDIWRIVWMPSADGRFIIAVGQEVEHRDDMALDMLTKQLYPWALLMPMLLLGLFWILSRELAPLKLITGQLKNREANDSRPLKAGYIPSEARPMVTALNDLFKRTGEMLLREKAFISDAAHELRTPLTALRVQAEVARMASDDQEALEHALKKLLSGIDKSTQLVEQLLTLSRLEAMRDTGSTALVTSLIDWVSMLDEMVLEYQAPSKKKGISMTCVIAKEPIPFTGYPVLLSLLLRNLLDNAVKYTPENGKINIVLESHCLTIENSGPGVPESFVQRLGERFARPPGQSGPGSGLGLSIAKRAAEANGLSLFLQNRLMKEGEGFVARVSMP